MEVKYMDNVLGMLGEQFSRCVKNRDTHNFKELVLAFEKLTCDDTLEKKMSLTEPLNSKAVVEIDLETVKRAIDELDDEEAPGQNYPSYELPTYSLSKQVVWDFVIEYLISQENFTCKSTEVADAFENKYKSEFNSFDMKIKESKDKRGNKERKIVAWKQRLWQVTSEMRRTDVIIGKTNNLYILAPKYRPK